MKGFFITFEGTEGSGDHPAPPADRRTAAVKELLQFCISVTQERQILRLQRDRLYYNTAEDPQIIQYDH